MGLRAMNSQTEPDMQPSCDAHTSLCWRWLPGWADTLSLGDDLQTVAQLPADPVCLSPTMKDVDTGYGLFV